jgi:hypothetical protein
VFAQADLEAAPSARALARAYDLVVFPGYHEYVTEREFGLVERYRDLGGNLMFLRRGWRLSRGGVEIDHTTRASPKGVRVLAESRDLFGRGNTAQMIFYETGAGAKVFAAGAIYLTRLLPRDRVVARLLETSGTASPTTSRDRARAPAV